MSTRWLFFWDYLHYDYVSLHLRVAACIRQQYSNQTDQHPFWIELFKIERLKILNFGNSYWPKQAHRPPNVKPLPPANCTKHGCSHQTCSVTANRLNNLNKIFLNHLKRIMLNFPLISKVNVKSICMHINIIHQLVNVIICAAPWGEREQWVDISTWEQGQHLVQRPWILSTIWK